jgi:hypothetical protein
MSKRLAPFYKRASPNMDEVSGHPSGGTFSSFVSCPLAVITREPLPQCAVDRGLPAVYRARLYLDGNFKIVDECLYPNPSCGWCTAGSAGSSLREGTHDGESPTLSREINVMVVCNDAGSPPVNAAYGYYVDEEDYLWVRDEVGNPEEIAHTALLRMVQKQMCACCEYQWERDGKEGYDCILSDDGTYPGYENAYFGVTSCQ